MIAMAAFLGVLFAAPLFFQIALGLYALQSGLNTFPEAIGVMVGAQIASRLLYPRIGPRRLVAAGLVGVACSTALMSLIGFDTDLWWMRLLMFTMGTVDGPGHRLVPGGLVRHRLHRRHRLRLIAVQQPAPAGQRAGRGPGHHRARRGGGHPSGGRPLRWPTWPPTTPPSWPPPGWPWSASVVALTINDADAAATMVRRGRRAAAPQPVSTSTARSVA